MRVHTISHTALDAPGGVPRFNRYLHRVLAEAGYEMSHWCWADAPGAFERYHTASEDQRAQWLSLWLFQTRRVAPDDVVIGDGFWCGELARLGCRRVISVAHGIWGHVTKSDFDAGVPPENPGLHAAQVSHRLVHRSRGLPIVAVSRFIADEMMAQWGIESTVINNAVDPDELPPPTPRRLTRSLDDRTIVIHGINDPGNVNKGWDHIAACMEGVPPEVTILSLDQYHEMVGSPGKMETLARADLVLAPSGFEGNSYFMLEALSCDVPVIAYNVGLPYEIAMHDEYSDMVGMVLDRKFRDPRHTANALRWWCSRGHMTSPREALSNFTSFDMFSWNWREIVGSICR